MNLHCAKYFSLFFLLFSCLILKAQSPEGINYQAALRDSESGEALKNEMVFVIITIRDGGPSGTIVYSESHSGITSNNFGLINLIIGGGDATDGSFEGIPWSTGNVWYEIEVDSGSGLQSLGSSQFLSVPFALFAGNAEQSLDNDPTNELIDSAVFDSEGQSILINESGNLVNVSLEGLDVNDGDADPFNELITSAIYDAGNNSIVLTQADGSEIAISLDELIVSDADSDPTNELIDPDEGLQLIGTNLVISEAGIPYSVNLNGLINDADADLTNELIDDQGFTLTNDTILTLTEAGINHSINLASVRDNDWKVDEEENKVYNENQKIGVGTDSPLARLDVVETTNTQIALNVVSGSETILRAANGRLGLGTNSANSKVQFGGSVGYDVRILSTNEVNNYAAGIDDHMMVVKFQPGGSSVFGIFLPPADVCEGRVYFIRKTGVVNGDLIIDTGVFEVDFSGPNVDLDDSGTQTAVMLSLGTDGWTRILRED